MKQFSRKKLITIVGLILTLNVLINCKPSFAEVIDAKTVQYSFEKSSAKGHAFSSSERKLKKKMSKLGTIARWHYDDYDGDGKKEAFSVLKNSDNSVKAVYFIDSKGETTLMLSSQDLYKHFILYTSKSKCFLRTNGKTFFTFTHNGTGSTWGDKSELFGVKNGKPYRLNISGTISGVYREKGVLFTISHRLTSYHSYMMVQLLYDKNSQQFYLGKDLGENSAALYDSERFA